MQPAAVAFDEHFGQFAPHRRLLVAVGERHFVASEENDGVAEALRAAEQSGELRSARDYGKPIDFGDGYDDTPPELRMAFKVLKDSGYTPPEIEMLHELAAMRKELEGLDPESPEAQALRTKVHDAELKVSLRIERLATRKL